MTGPGDAPFSSNNLLRQPAWLAAIFITVIILGWHFYFWWHAGGLWRDEVNLINLASRSSVAGMAQDSFPVLMPLLVKAWTAVGFGRDDGLLRLLGLFIGAGIVAGFWVATWTARRSPPLFGLVLVGLNSTVISYGDSMRAYGLGSLWIVFTFAAAVWFLQRASWWRAGIVAVFAVLGVQTLFHDAVFVAAVCLGGAGVCMWRKDWRAMTQILAAGLVAALSLIPYVPNLVAAQDSSVVLRTGLAWPRLSADLTTAIGFPWKQYTYVWGGLLLVAAITAILAGLRIRRGRTKPAETITGDEMSLFAGTTLLCAVAGYLGFLWLASMPGQPWYFLPLMVLAAACFDTVCGVRRGWSRVVFLGFMLVTTAISLPVIRRDLDYRLTNIDTWAQGLAAGAQREDFILVTPWFCGITFSHYFQGATPWTTIPPLADHFTAHYDLVREEMKKTNVMQPFLDKMAATLQAGHRVWLLAPVGALSIPAPGTPPPVPLPPAPLPDSGWADEPYSFQWSMEVMHFLSSRSRSFGRTQNPDAGRHIAENLELFVAEGWRESGGLSGKTD